MKELKHSCKILYEKGLFEAGTVQGSMHPRNNIYLRYKSGVNSRYEHVEVTVDEAAAIIACLSHAIIEVTNKKRDELSPDLPKK